MTLSRVAQEESGRTRGATMCNLQLMPHLPRTLMLPASPGQWAAAGLHRHAGSCVAARSAGGRPCASPVVCKDVHAAAVSVKLCRNPQWSTRASPQQREGCARRREPPGDRRGRPGPSTEAALRQRSAIVHTARWRAPEGRATQQLAPGSSWAVSRKLCAERETLALCVQGQPTPKKTCKTC